MNKPIIPITTGSSLPPSSITGNKTSCLKLEFFWKQWQFIEATSSSDFPPFALLLMKQTENNFSGSELTLWPSVSFSRPSSTRAGFPPLPGPPTRFIADLSCTSLRGIKAEIGKRQLLLQLTRTSPACAPVSSASPGRLRAIAEAGAVWKLFRLFALVDLFQVRHMFFKKRMPKITKNAKERGKGGLIQSPGVNRIRLPKQPNVQGHLPPATFRTTQKDGG